SDPDRLQHSEEPERLAFVVVQQVPELRALVSDRGHCPLPPGRCKLPLQRSLEKQLQRGLSLMKQTLSSPSPERLRCWRLFFESWLALGDVLDTELEEAVGIPQRWYDVLVHLEESPGGIRMNELAERILYSKSGFTRVIDRMEAEGLVERVHPADDR